MTEDLEPPAVIVIIAALTVDVDVVAVVVIIGKNQYYFNKSVCTYWNHRTANSFIIRVSRGSYSVPVMV